MKKCRTDRVKKTYLSLPNLHLFFILPPFHSSSSRSPTNFRATSNLGRSNGSEASGVKRGREPEMGIGQS